MKSLVRYQGPHEWSALYVDGVLDRVGDHYLVDDRIAELAGVEIRYSDDFMCGGDQRRDVAPVLSDAEAWSEQRATFLRTADEHRRQAADLIKAAEGLEGKAR